MKVLSEWLSQWILSNCLKEFVTGTCWRSTYKMSTKNLFFSSVVRDFQVYKRNLKPEEGELLKCSHEEDNLYDIFSIKVYKSGTDEIAGHLPMPINRITKFMMAGGISVTLKIIGKYHRRSHLVHGELEGPCEMMVIMSRSLVNHLLLTRYEKLVNELYIELKNKEIV